MPTTPDPRRRLRRAAPLALALVLSAALARPAAAAPLAPWDTLARFARTAAAWADRGLGFLFADQGSVTDPDGKVQPPPGLAAGGLGGLFADEGSITDPNGKTQPPHAAGEWREEGM